MSLFGKILALINMLGAAGLVYLALMDYAKRQSWAHSVFLHERVVRGVPLDENEVDDENVPLVARMSDQGLKHLFSTVGSPVETQVAEVKRVQGLLNAQIDKVGDKAQQSYQLARILLPQSDTVVDREQALACIIHFATPDTVKGLRQRCQMALEEARRTPVIPPLAKEEIGELTGPKAPAKVKDTATKVEAEYNKAADAMQKSERSFHDAFRLAFRSQNGPPADKFVSDVLRGLEPTRDKAPSTIDEAFNKALEAQRADLKTRYDALFTAALPSPNANPQGQKAIIARLLFGLCVPLAEDALLTDQSKAEEKKKLVGPAYGEQYQSALVATKTFETQVRRVQVVCGLRAGIRAVSERAAVLRRLGDSVSGSIIEDREQFITDHASILESLRQQANLARSMLQLVNETQARVARQTATVEARKIEIKEVNEELDKSREETLQKVTALSKASLEVLKTRQSVRDAIRDTYRGEVRIRELEKRIRELESRR